MNPGVLCTPTAYYGKPVLNAPVWEPRDIAGYLFLGGLAGASSLLGAGAQLTGRTALERAAKAGSLGAACLSMAALVHDLGRPARFADMLRVLKISSPMSVATYTAVLISDTAVPAWHDAHSELPFVFAGSAATAAVGLGLLAAPPDQNAPARNLGLLGAGLELAAFRRMIRRIGMVARPTIAAGAAPTSRPARH